MLVFIDLGFKTMRSHKEEVGGEEHTVEPIPTSLTRLNSIKDISDTWEWLEITARNRLLSLLNDGQD